jgi:ribosomal protein S18 acetylase RimI-like enzyme
MKNNNVTYRSDVKPSDIEAVGEIVRSTNFFNTEEIEVAMGLVEETVETGKDSGYDFIFAEIDGKVIGYTCYGRIPCTKHSFDLYWIATHQDYRGMGIGKELMDRTEKAIKEIGGNGVYVETSSKEQYHPTRSFILK